MKEPEINGAGLTLIQRRRLLSIFEWALVALLAIYMGVRAYPRAWQTLETDFPNYYLTARLVHEHYDTSRIYEWQWLQRQKDHRGLDQRLVGMVPITPFSTLLVWPIALKPPLQAKHIWLIFNACLLVATITILQKLTQLPWRRVALVAAVSIPLRVNFMFGQYYIVPLFVLSLSCLLYTRQQRFFSGLLIGFAAALKIFPAIYFFYFLRRKDWKALFGAVTSGIVAIVLSLFVFGWNLHRTYLTQVLPSVFRGEGLDPYNLAASSLSSLLHSLFIFEPQLNPHPAINAPLLFALLHPLFQMLIVAPALLLTRPTDSSPSRLKLEWSAVLLVSLAVSTSPASYLFTLLILPVCLMSSHLYEQRSYRSLAVLLCVYLGVGFARVPRGIHSGWHALMGVPRLYLLIFLCIFAFILLFDRFSRSTSQMDQLWQAMLAIALILNIASNVRHQRGIYSNYQARVPATVNAFMVRHASVQPDSLAYISMMNDGYRLTEQSRDTTHLSPIGNNDFLAVAAASQGFWVEEAGLQSSIVPTKQNEALIHQAESPAASSDGRFLSYLRDEQGRSRIWLRSLAAATQRDVPLTPPTLNVLDVGFLADNTLVFSASSRPELALYTVDLNGSVKPLEIEAARYPAGSPDGRWLVYSKLIGGSWNLWLRDQRGGTSRRLTDAACNDVDPTWTLDSKSIIYSSDCGRGLWFTALCKRRIIQ